MNKKKNKQVLVIDDEPVTVKVTTLILERNGYEVITAQDGQEGLDMAQRHGPDLILLDIMMPGLDGWEVLSRLRQMSEVMDIPVILFSAKDYPNGKELARQYGAVDYIRKPFTPASLRDVLSCY